MDCKTPVSDARFRRAPAAVSNTCVLVGIFLALFSTPREELVTFSNIKHDPLGVWIGQFVRYCTCFRTELAPVLCNINIS